MEEIREIFLTEIHHQFRQVVLLLEAEPLERANWPQVQRVMHSLKGSAPMFGYAHVAPLAASVEQWMKQKNSHGQKSFSPDEMHAMLRTVEVLTIYLRSPEVPDPEVVIEQQSLIDFFHREPQLKSSV